MNCFQCVADLQRRYGVKRLRGIFGISRPSFYYWCRTAANRAARQAADARLAARIRAGQDSEGTCGAPGPGRPRLQRREAQTKYVGAIACLPVDGGKFCCLATVIELASRRLAGWAVADRVRADLVTGAPAAAIRTRGGLAGSIVHTGHEPSTRAGPSPRHAGQ